MTNFEIQRYYQHDVKLNSKNEVDVKRAQRRFIGIYSKINLPKIKDREYEANLDKFANIENHWISIYLKNNVAIYFDNFGVEVIP